MKQKLLIFFFSLLLIFSISNVVCAEDEHIESFSSDIQLQSDGQAQVKETIKYVFSQPKHGIYRTIPYKYEIKRDNQGSSTYTVNFENINVKIENQGQENDVPFKETKEGSNIKIQIGDANKTVSGSVTYVISYTADNIISFSPKGNEEQDEFYWNVTGNGWGVPISSSEAKIHFPVDIDPNTWKTICFTGSLGSQQNECLIQVSGQKDIQVNGKWALNPNEGLTFDIGFPKGIFQPPSTSEKLQNSLKNNLFAYFFLVLPILTFVCLFILWFLKGRDPHGQGTIIPFYAPPDDLTPVEVGTLIDEKADLKDISSAIINLAVKGYLKIVEVENKAFFGIFRGKRNYDLQLLKRDDALPRAEKEIFQTIFQGRNSIRLDELQEVFPQNLQTIKDVIYDGLVDKGYFPKNPERVRNAYLSVGIVIIILGFIMLSNRLSFIAMGSLVLSGILIALFGMIMPKKTVKGVNTKEKILGLREYLTVAEKDRIEFHNAPSKNPKVFERLLPYAMVLGVEREWAKQFEGIYNQPPTWYEGGAVNNFNALYLVSAMNDFRSVANASMGVKFEGGGAASGLSGFGGGGFSGGGFGGGGGGSW